MRWQKQLRLAIAVFVVGFAILVGVSMKHGRRPPPPPSLDIKNQPWATIPWKYSITEARQLAAKTRKPIFIVVNTGNALGCT